MNNGRDFTLLQNLIQNNLSFAYNKNVPKVNFSLSSEFSDHSVFEFQDLKLSFVDKPEFDCSEISHWRLPQTRIKIAFIRTSQFQICILKYFENYCLLFKNLSKETYSFALDFYAEKNINYNNRFFKASNIDLSCGAFSRIIIMAGPTNQDLNNIPKFWLESINKEKKLHPLGQIYSFNLEFMKNIDQYWSELSDIGIDGELKYYSKKENNAIKILLYTELFLLLGREEELQTFWNEKRVDAALKRIVTYYTSSFTKSEQLYQLPSNDVFDILTNSHFLDDNLIKQYVQNTWNSISLPCRKFYLIRQVKINPIKIIAFILLILKTNLWWREKAFTYLSEIVDTYDSEQSSLINLIGLIKLKPSIYYSKGTVAFNCLSFNQDIYEIAHQAYSIRSSKKSRQVSSFFKLDGEIEIWIDKTVKLYVDNQNKFIKMHPANNIEQNLNIFTINYKCYDIKIPLCWTDFTVKINLLRLKFLFKKNRFQVSVKGAKELTSCKLNNIEFSFDRKQYHKMYVELNKLNPVHEISYFDYFGREYELKDWPSPTQKLLLDAKAVNKFGLLHSYVQYQKTNSTKNIKIDLASMSPQSLDIQHPFYLKFPKEERLDFSPSFSQTSLNRLLNTDAIELKNGLIVYARKNFNNINSFFLNNFGFLPQIELIENINHTCKQISLIIGGGEDQKFEKGSADLGTKLKNTGKEKVIFISENDLESWFKTTFFNL